MMKRVEAGKKKYQKTRLMNKKIDTVDEAHLILITMAVGFETQNRQAVGFPTARQKYAQNH